MALSDDLGQAMCLSSKGLKSDHCTDLICLYAHLLMSTMFVHELTSVRHYTEVRLAKTGFSSLCLLT